VALVLLAALSGGAACAAVHTDVMTAVKACEPEARALLQTLVQIDSGTADIPGVTAVGALLKSELQRSGAEVGSVPATTGAADNIVATVKGSGKGRLLVIAHMDTVFPHGTVALRPYAVTGERGVGPGAGDDKSGVVLAVCALRVLQQIRFHDFARITLIVNSNEETGSFGTRDLIRTQARQSDVAINLERGVPPDGLVIGRKGSAVITLEITGHAAHAGLEPEKGRNAVIEAAQQALRLGTLADPSRETTVNVTVIEGGNATNVIPDHALLKADVRAFTPEEFDRIEKALQELAANPSVPDVQVHAQLARSFPPWPRATSTDALLARAQQLYAEIGGTLTGIVVGSSADVALAAETGTPAIDGVGIRGGGAHGPEDYADLSSIVPRVYLLSRMLMDLGRDPALATRKH